MKKIGITGSLASGKTTASIILSKKNGPLFSADDVVKKLYKNNSFKNLIRKNFKIKEKDNIKRILKIKILQRQTNIKKLEKIIHPIVRKEMGRFTKRCGRFPLTDFAEFVIVLGLILIVFWPSLRLFLSQRQISRFECFVLPF